MREIARGEQNGRSWGGRGRGGWWLLRRQGRRGWGGGGRGEGGRTRAGAGPASCRGEVLADGRDEGDGGQRACGGGRRVLSERGEDHAGGRVLDGEPGGRRHCMGCSAEDGRGWAAEVGAAGAGAVGRRRRQRDGTGRGRATEVDPSPRLGLRKGRRAEEEIY